MCMPITNFDSTNISIYINVGNVRTNQNQDLLYLFFNGSKYKYSHCFFKIMTGITFMGVIIFYTCPAYWYSH